MSELKTMSLKKSKVVRSNIYDHQTNRRSIYDDMDNYYHHVISNIPIGVFNNYFKKQSIEYLKASPSNIKCQQEYVYHREHSTSLVNDTFRYHLLKRKCV